VGHYSNEEKFLNQFFKHGEQMKALRKVVAGPGAVLQEVAVPQPGPGEALVRVHAAGVCGTDKHIYQWDKWSEENLRLPLTFGHELVGVVEELGPQTEGFPRGQLVAAETHLFCGVCRPCRQGNQHVCANFSGLGVHRDGSFAEYVVVPVRSLWAVDEGIERQQALLLEPLGNAVHAALHFAITGKSVLVSGCGPIGLMTIAVAQRLGAHPIVATDVIPYRLALAVQMGATKTIDASNPDLVDQVLAATDGGADVTLEMSGHPTAIHQAIRSTVNGGKVSLLGIPPGHVSLDLTDEIISRGLELYGVNGRRIFETWRQAEGLLQSGLDLSPIVTHGFRLEHFEFAMSVVLSGGCGKVVLLP